MGHLCNSVDVMVLRQNRQKMLGIIQPAFNNKYGYGPDYSYFIETLWYSKSDDVANGIDLEGYFTSGTATTNFSIPLPSTEVFHMQAEYVFPAGRVSYTSDSPKTDVRGSAGQTITCGVRLLFQGPTSDYYTRDKPWLKFGISWDCYGSLTQYEQTLLYYESFPFNPIYSSPNAIANVPFYWFNQIEPQGPLGQFGTYQSNSIFIPADTYTLPPEPPEGGWPEPPLVGFYAYPAGTKRMYWLGSISVGNINTYRRGNYHHG